MSVDLPTPESTEQLVATLEGYLKGGKACRLSTIGPRLLGAVQREHVHGSDDSDGYGTQTIGDGMPRGSGSGLTATEAAASARMGRRRPDAHRALTGKAAVAMERAVDALGALLVALDALDDLRGPDAVHEPCDACGPHRDVLADIHARGDVGGRLDAPMALCETCYEFVRRHNTPPTPTQIAHHEGTGRWPR